jgi:hypothetical protein
MPNTQETTGKKPKIDFPQKSGMTTQNESTPKESSNESQGTKLDQFVSYAKENWREVLAELVTAGVTAYIAQNAKSKSQKN